MMKAMKYIGSVLKTERTKSGKSVKDALACLLDHGIKVTESTIYNWENDISMPNADPLLVLCDFYGVDNVLGTFGYGTKKSPTPEESEEEDYGRTLLLENYDGMNEAGKEELVKHSRLLVNSVEYKKCASGSVGKGGKIA